MKNTAWMVGAAALLAACEPTTDQDATPTQTTTATTTAALPTERPKMSLTTDVLMKDHFSQALAMRRAVIAGNIDEARAPAQWFADFQGLEALDDNWRPPMKTILDAAKSADGAQDLDTLANAVGTIGQACGSCHTAVGGPKITIPPLPEASGTGPHMQKHAWALERLWDGLVGPSDEAWQAGADALADVPLTPGELAPSTSIPEVEKLAKRVHELGPDAVKADKGDRRRVYGELLTTCGSCHEALKVTPR